MESLKQIGSIGLAVFVILGTFALSYFLIVIKKTERREEQKRASQKVVK